MADDEPLLPPMDNIVDLSKVKEDISLENAHKDLIQKIDFNVADQVEKSLQHPWLYEVGDRVISHDGAERGLPPLRITGRVVRSKGLLEGSEPSQGLFLRGPDVPYYMVERDDGSNMSDSIPEWAVKQKFGVRGEVADLSTLDKGIMAADLGSKILSEIPPPKKPPPGQELVKQEKTPSKAQMFSGIGSLMRKRISPLVTAAQLFWGEMPDSVKDDAGEIVDWLRENKMHELVGLDKPGLEYFKEALGLAPQGPTDPMAMPNLWDDTASRMQRARDMGFDLDETLYHGTSDDIKYFSLTHSNRKDSGWLGTGVYLTDDPSLASIYGSMKPSTSNAGPNILPVHVKLKNPYYASINDKLRLKNIFFDKGKEEARVAADAWTTELKKKGHDGVILEFDPKDDGSGSFGVGFPAHKEVVVFEPENIRSSFAKFDPADADSDFLSKAEGGFVEKPTEEPGTTDLEQVGETIDELLPRLELGAELSSRIAGEIPSVGKGPPGKQPSNLPVPVKPKPSLRRGIGGLKRAPFFALVQMGWDSFSPEQKQQAKDYAVEAWGSFENAWEAALAWKRRNLFESEGAGGLDWAKEALMPTAQEPKGIMSLTPMLQSGEYASETVEGRVPVYHASPSPEIKGDRFDVEGYSLTEDRPIGQGAAARGTGQYGAQARAVAEDYFTREPSGRLLVNGKLLPKAYNFPQIWTERDLKIHTDSGYTSDEELARVKGGMESFAKKLGVERKDLKALKEFAVMVESYGRERLRFTDYSAVSQAKIKLRNEVATNLRQAELEKEAGVPIEEERLKIVAGRAQRILDVANKYNFGDTPGVLVEYAYHPDDWKNMIDLDKTMREQPEILEKVKKTWLGKAYGHNLNYGRSGASSWFHRPSQSQPKPLENMTGDELSREFLKIIERSEHAMKGHPIRAGEPNIDRSHKISLAREFAEAGIPGNKYFDQDSRHAPEVDTSKVEGFSVNGSSLGTYLKKVKPPVALSSRASSVMAFEKHTKMAMAEIEERMLDLIDQSGDGPLPEKPLDKILRNVERYLAPDADGDFLVGVAETNRMRLVRDVLKEMIADEVEVDLVYAQDRRTQNAVVWDQKAMDRATKPVVLEGGRPPRKKAEGGLVDKPLYEQPRMVG